jgi:hypothetical protein
VKPRLGISRWNRPARTVAFSRARGHGAIFQHSRCLGSLIPPLAYKGFTITARTFQVRGTGRWTLDLLIGRRGRLRAFSSPNTYSTEAAAIAGCHQLGQRIIDGRVRDCSVADLD